MRVALAPAMLAALTSFTEWAEAQSPAKRFQFGLDGTLIAAESGTITLEDVDFDYTSTQGGLASGLGMTLGIGLTDSIVLNTRLVQSSGTTRLEGDASSSESRASTFSLLPRLEVLFGPSAARFFLFGTMGYRSSVSHSTFQSRDPQSGGFLDDSSRLKTTGITFGAGLGLHGFVGDPRIH